MPSGPPAGWTCTPTWRPLPALRAQTTLCRWSDLSVHIGAHRQPVFGLVSRPEVPSQIGLNRYPATQLVGRFRDPVGVDAPALVPHHVQNSVTGCLSESGPVPTQEPCAKVTSVPYSPGHHT